jgi:hypothetical protein
LLLSVKDKCFVKAEKDEKPLSLALSLSVGAMTVLGSIVIGLRHSEPWLPLLAAIVPAMSFLVTDVWKVARLNWWVANAITVLAVGWSLRSFLPLSSEEKLMAIASMICLLQIVLMFQEKTPRIYWHLVVLSVLQVVVASALDLGAHFVPLIVLFLAIGLATLILLAVYREVTAPRAEKSSFFQSWRGKSLLSRQQPAGREKLPAKAEDPSHRLASQAAMLLSREPRLTAMEHGEKSLLANFPTRLLMGNTLLLSAATLLLAMVFFYSTPRMKEVFRPEGGSLRGAATGFQPEVRLPRNGRIHLSNRPVMRVQLSRMSDRQPVELAGEPYFHGAILSEYVTDESGSRWVEASLMPTITGGRGLLRAVPQTSGTLVRQDIILESNAGRRFAINPVLSLPDEAIPAFGAPHRGRSDRGQHSRYAWATPAIISRTQVKAIPNPNRRITALDEIAFIAERSLATKFNAEQFPRLKQIADEELEQHQLSEGSTFNKAMALERHFLTIGSYDYTLNLDFTGEGIDPIEDFVANVKAGHCEYFASALVMMLRSQGIPARLVRGYRGGTYNSVGKYYLVQERNAHSWVEAWLPNDELPPGENAGVLSEGGAWYRLDPTPGLNNQIVLEDPDAWDRMAQAFDYVELLWRDYVLSLNSSRQEEMVYAPLTAQAGALPQWTEFKGPLGFMRKMGALVGIDMWPRTGRGARAFEGWAAIFVIVGLVALVASIGIARGLWGVIFRWRKNKHSIAANRSPAFYRRLERLLARVAVMRGGGETAREMARVAEAKFAVAEGAQAVAALPEQLVAAYYRVRFGGGCLDKVESDGIEQSLHEIELVAARMKRKR